MCIVAILARRRGYARLLDSLELGGGTASSSSRQFHAEVRFFGIASHDVISSWDARGGAGRRTLYDDGGRHSRLWLLVLLKVAQRVLARSGAFCGRR